MSEPKTQVTPEPLPVDVLACPRCDRELSERRDVLHCKGCNVDFPLVGGSIPWLFSEPNAALAEWRNRYQFAIDTAHRDARQADAEAKEVERTSTRTRLGHLAKAKRKFAAELEALLEPLSAVATDMPLETHLALKTRLPPTQGIDTYHANVHRDWCWGDEENEVSLQLVRAALPDAPRRVLVLGCGAGRLAYDLHEANLDQQTFALDLNPLLIFIAARASAGQTVQLHEFPLAPRTVNDIARRRTLAAPAQARPGLHWLLGDALRPPFPPGAFDAVITPWFVDIIDQELDTTAARINRMLALGGRWVSFGSLAFAGPDYRHRYSVEEARDVIRDAGFEAPEINETTIPYLCSPASRHGRRERVVTLSAVKRNSVSAPARHTALPEWVVRSNQPVPLLDSFQTQATTTRIYAFIMSLIDGRRTIADMAALMEEQRLMAKDDADEAIRGFLIKMYDEARGSRP